MVVRVCIKTILDKPCIIFIKYKVYFCKFRLYMIKSGVNFVSKSERLLEKENNRAILLTVERNAREQT